MSKWKEYKLGNVATIVDCEHKTAPLVDFSDYISVRTSDISNGKIDYDSCNRVSVETFEYWTKRLQPKDGDIVLAREAPVGEVGLIKKNRKICLGQRTVLIRADENFVSKNFLLYYLANSDTKNDLISRSTGSVVEHLNVKDIKDFDLKVPVKVDEQKRIADVLTCLDDKIDLLFRQNKTLEQLAKTLFRQWFVMNGVEERKEIFLKEIYSFEKGVEPGSKFYLEEPNSNSIRFIRVGDMRENSASLYVDAELAKGKICTKKDLLVSFDGTVGRVIFGIEGCYSSGMRKITSENPLFNSLWLKHQIFISKEIQDAINTHASGTVILHAGSSINYLTINFPNETKLKECNDVMKPLYDKIECNLTQISTLEKQLKTLLPKLMSGAVSVK